MCTVPHERLKLLRCQPDLMLVRERLIRDGGEESAFFRSVGSGAWIFPAVEHNYTDSMGGR